MPSERDKASENPYEPAESIQHSHYSWNKPEHLSFTFILFIVGVGFAIVTLPLVVALITYRLVFP